MSPGSSVVLALKKLFAGRFDRCGARRRICPFVRLFCSFVYYGRDSTSCQAQPDAAVKANESRPRQEGRVVGVTSGTTVEIG